MRARSAQRLQVVPRIVHFDHGPQLSGGVSARGRVSGLAGSSGLVVEVGGEEGSWVGPLQDGEVAEACEAWDGVEELEHLYFAEEAFQAGLFGAFAGFGAEGDEFEDAVGVGVGGGDGGLLFLLWWWWLDSVQRGGRVWFVELEDFAE